MNAFPGICLNLLLFKNTVHEPLVGKIFGIKVRFRFLQYTVEDLESHLHGSGNGQGKQEKMNGRRAKMDTGSA